MAFLRFQTEAVGTASNFNYDAIPVGYYHRVMEKGNPIRRAWHLQKFERVLDCLPLGNSPSLLDIGCFAGTFLSMVPPERFSKQVGVDILKKQINYAKKRFGTSYRQFHYIKDISQLNGLGEQFDCVTLIEVIEHLNRDQISEMLAAIAERLKRNGKLVISTPNYSSTWPAIEILLNRMSDISYEEQHLNKFNYFSVKKKLKELYPDMENKFKLDFKTTTHFMSPFLAAASLPFSRKVSRLYSHNRWHLPFGNLILIAFTRL